MVTCRLVTFSLTKLRGKFGNEFMSSEFWNDKKILVTGATGFIGSWLTEELVKRNSNVTVFVKKDDPLREDAIKHLAEKIKIVYGDIRNKSPVEVAVKDQEIIFHLAAFSQVINSMLNPVETVEVNTIGTMNFLEAVRKSNLDQTFVFASTDKVYGEPQYLPIDEKHPLSAKSPYDASKLAADRLTFSYFVSYGIKASISRWSNTIGGRDANHLRALPDFIISLLNNKSPTIRGDGKHVRDYMYVTDSTNGIMLLAEKINLTKGESFNFGTERPTSVMELADLVIKTMNLENKFKPVILNNPTPGEINKQFLSAKKATEILKWKPEISLEEGVKRTIEWYSQNRWWEDVINRVKNSS